jgi:hypothetical protein
MVYMLQCGIKSPRATQRLVCNPGVVSKTLTCIYDCAAVNWLRIKLTNLRRHAPRVKPGLHKAVHVARDYIQALCFARGLFSFPEFCFD